MHSQMKELWRNILNPLLKPWHLFIHCINYIVKRNSKQSVKYIPGPWSLPFLGTTWSSSAGNSDLNATSEKMVKLYGPIVKLEHYWNYPLILLYDGDHIEIALKAGSLYRPEMEIVTSHRRRRPDLYDLVGIVNSQGEDWKKFRSRLHSMNHQATMTEFLPSCDEIVMDFISILRDLGTNYIPNFDDYILRLTFEHSSKFTLNKRLHCLDLRKKQQGKMDVFIHASHQYFKALQVSMYGFPAWKYFPGSQVWTQFVKYEEEMYDIFADFISEDVKTGSAQGLLKTILRSTQLTLKDRITFTRDLILAAMEPIQNSTLIVLYWISRHPKVESKLLAEIKAIFPLKNSKLDEKKFLNGLPYLSACIQESFRLSPVTPNLARLLETGINLGNFYIPPYTLVICQHWYACLQDTNFVRPTEFIPERWIQPEKFQPHKPRLLYHFGYGRRECPGRRFAILEMTVTVAKLLRNFQLKFPIDLNLQYHFLQEPSFPVPVEITERRN